MRMNNQQPGGQLAVAGTVSRVGKRRWELLLNRRFLKACVRFSEAIVGLAL
jgi:hypothetical protein